MTDKEQEEAEWLEGAKECDGVEVHQCEWPVIERLIAKGLAKWVSGARGPDRAWKRMEAV